MAKIENKKAVVNYTPIKKKKVNKNVVAKLKTATKARTIANGQGKDQKQAKKLDNPNKRSLSDTLNNNDDGEEEVKKPKLDKVNDRKTISFKNIIPAVFKIFSNIQSEHLSQSNLRKLVDLLRNESNEEMRLDTCSYTLKRLIRATGSDDMQSVSQSAANIHCILSSVPNINIYDLLETMKRELPISESGGKPKKGKTDSLASVGHVITVNTIMHTSYFTNAEPTLITDLYKILVGQLKGREYLASMSANILVDSFTKVNVSVLKSHVWPLLKSEILLPIGKQKMYIIDIALAAHFNNIVSRDQLEPIVSLKNFKDLFEIYINGSIMQNVGTYKRFAKFLIQKEQSDLLKRWQKYVEDKVDSVNNSRFKICVLQVIIYVLMHCNERSDQTIIIDLFSPKVLNMLCYELQTAKKRTNKKTKTSQLELNLIFPQLETMLLIFYKSHISQDNVKVEILTRLFDNAVNLDSLILMPKYTDQMINELSPEGASKIYNLFKKNLLSETVSKQLQMYSLHRIGFILQHDKLPKDHRKAEMLHMLYMAIFHVNNEIKPCPPGEAIDFDKTKSSQCRSIFFNSILARDDIMDYLPDELTFYSSNVSKALANKTQLLYGLHIMEEEDNRQIIENILLEYKKNKKNTSDKLKQTLDLLIMFVSLAQLSADSPVATILKDLIQCKKFATSKEKETKEMDLSWKEVLTDSLLVLNLQNEQFWRKLINLVLGNLIDHLEEQHLEQILAVLNMRKNPLSKNENEDEDDDDDDEDDDDDDDDDDEDDDEEEDESTDDQDSIEGEEEDNDNEDEDVENDDEEAEENDRLEQLRESVRLALTKDVTNNGDDGGDASSVDWNDVDEEEGERLNAALERTFQAFKPKTTKSQSKRRPPKSERINSTTLMHFRIRALDMLELFVSKKPEIEIILDIIQSVFQVFISCSIGPNSKQQQLREASIKLMRKIINQEIVHKANQNKDIILEVIEQLMATSTSRANNDEEEPQKHEPKAAIEVTQWRDKLLAHLVSQFSSGKKPTNSPVWPLIQSYIDEWISKRQTRLTLSSFEAIFNSNWPGVAHLANTLSSHLISDKTRSQRRYQILKLLSDHSNRFNLIYKEVPNSIDALQQNIIKYAELATAKPDFQKSKEGKLLSKILAQGTDPKCREIIDKIAIS